MSQKFRTEDPDDLRRFHLKAGSLAGETDRRTYEREDIEPVVLYEDEHGREVMRDLDWNKPDFANAREAVEHLRQGAEEARKEAAEAAKERIEQERQEHQARISDPLGNSALERGFIEAYSAEMAQHTADWQRMQHEVQSREAEIERLKRTPGPAALHRANQIIRELQSLEPKATELTKQRQNLTEMAGQAQSYMQQRDLQSARLDLHQSVPELADPVKAEQFKGWLRSQGATDGMIASERDPGVIIRAAKTWRAEEREAKQSAARKRIKALNTRGRTGVARTSADARKALKESGSMDDLLNLMHIRRQERREGLR